MKSRIAGSVERIYGVTRFKAVAVAIHITPAPELKR